MYSDDIQNAIDYLKLKAFGEPVVTVTGDSRALGLANLPPDPCEDTLSDACIKAVRIGNNPYLVYDGIYIYSQKGDEKYLNYVAATLDFAKEFSPVDYQFIKQWSKWIEIEPNQDYASSGGTGFYIDRGDLKICVENGGLEYLLRAAVHESAHNSRFSTDNSKYDSDMFGDEQYPIEAGEKAITNVSYVTKEMKEAFYREHLPDVEFKYPKWREQS
ncbi:MAG: hypothetical protein ABIH80_05405 [Methanobacteriota archaeon]